MGVLTKIRSNAMHAGRVLTSVGASSSFVTSLGGPQTLYEVRPGTPLPAGPKPRCRREDWQPKNNAPLRRGALFLRTPRLAEPSAVICSIVALFTAWSQLAAEEAGLPSASTASATWLARIREYTAALYFRLWLGFQVVEHVSERGVESSAQEDEA
jgi:hypothetical protein